MRRPRLILTTLIALITFAGVSQPAEAGPVLSLSYNGTSRTISDGSGYDVNPFTGAVTYLGSFGDFIINVSTGVSQPYLGTLDAPHLDLSSINITGSGGGGWLTISFSDDGFTPHAPALTSFTSSIGGVIGNGGKLIYSTYLGTTLLGRQYYSSGAFSGVFLSNDHLIDTTYALTQVVSLYLPESWQATSFNAELAAVPEPGSLLLLGSGLLGVAWRARRRQRQSAETR